MKDKVNISIIIPTFNRINSLKDTINSYLNSDIIPIEIIIVDQSTLTEIRAKIQEFCVQKNIKYIFSEIPSSAIARNIGIENASNDLIIFSDDDVLVDKTILTKVYNRFKDNSIGLVGGLNINDKKQGKLGYFFGTKSFIKRKIGHVTNSILGRYPNQIKNEVETEWAMGYFFVVRKSLIKKVNCYFDENFTSYSYAEDLDFSYRYIKEIKKLGYKAILNPEIKVDHLASKEYRVPNEKSDMMYVINRYYIAHKNGFGFKARIAMWWSNLGMMIFNKFNKINNKGIKKGIKYLNKNKKRIENGCLDIKLEEK